MRAPSKRRSAKPARPDAASPRPKRVVALAERASRADKQPRGEAVVAAVINATVEELAKVGYEGLSIDAVAQRAGVNKTTVYRRWPTKADLVIASVQAAKAEFKCPDTGSVRGDLIVMLSSIRDFMTTNQGHCFFKMFFERNEDPDLLRAFRAMRESTNDPPRMVLARAMDRGELPKESDPHLLMLSMVGALRHLVLFEREIVTRARIEAIVDLLLYGATRSR